MQHDPRRHSPRIGIEALCWEVVGEREVSSLVVDLSTHGARLERPFVPGPHAALLGERDVGGQVPLQIEVPGIDEVMWARGEVVFDNLVHAPSNGGPFGLLRRTGYRIAIAAARDLRLLRDFVYDTYARMYNELELGPAGRPDLVHAR